ncbi:MAG TPA: response regulator [Aggregatilineaceae bacterium]|jgi:DNA-binding response OmpR family regulator|nr:response regulator [Aggregatilineaceae bacterium]
MAMVFILEDDPDLLNLYSRALKFRGYNVMCADSAERAISMLGDGGAPDIAVLDMSMPGLPGSAVVEFIRSQSRFRDLPVIAISCNEDFRQMLLSSEVTFMTKPINLIDLYRLVSLFVPVDLPTR